VLALLAAIQVTARQERELEAEIVERLELYADAAIFTMTSTRAPRAATDRHIRARCGAER
jgi:hypothetical protein